MTVPTLHPSFLTRRMLMASCAAAAAAVALPALPARAAEPVEINFGVISTDASQNIKSQWTPFLQDMEKATGLKVNGFFPSDYAGVIEAMRFNKVQLAWYGNASAIQAVDRADGEVFVHKTYADGTNGYYSLLIVNKESPVHSLDDLLQSPGKYSFGNGDPNSTSGFLIPGYYVWAKHNVDVRKFFKNVVTANHETNLMAVANRQVDVATNNTEELAKFEKAQPAKAALVREIWRSPLIPADPIVWRKDLPDPVKANIKGFFLAYGTERPGADVAYERAVLAGLGGWGTFVTSSNAQLLSTRQVSLYKDRLQVEQDQTLGAEEKARRAKEIDAKLNDIERQMAAASPSQ